MDRGGGGGRLRQERYNNSNLLASIQHYDIAGGPGRTKADETKSVINNGCPDAMLKYCKKRTTVVTPGTVRRWGKARVRHKSVSHPVEAYRCQQPQQNTILLRLTT